MTIKKIIVGIILCSVLLVQNGSVVSVAAGYDAALAPNLMAVASEDNVTPGQKNAVSFAKSYLYVMPLSKDKLEEQLVYEGYTLEDARYGVENCGADWKEQAVRAAKDYLDYMSFSAKGLQEQLEFEDFSGEEAKYGVENCGADWNEQAGKSAANFLSMMSLSGAELKERLVFDGFTDEQAEYGVSACGF